MFFKILNSSKIKFRRVVFHIFLIISYMTTFSSCMTTYSYSEFPGNLDKVTSSDITKIELNNGTTIDCKGKLIKFEGSDSVKNIIIKSYTVGEGYKTYWNEKRIQISDVFKIQVDKSEINGTKTTLRFWA